VSRDSEARDLASASYQRCPEAAPRFARTDFERLNRLLRHALGLLLVFPRQPEQEPSLLGGVAVRHSRWDLNVPPSLYPPFVDSLVATVRQYDPAFTPEVEEAWRRTVDRGVKCMIARYDSAD